MIRVVPNAFWRQGLDALLHDLPQRDGSTTTFARWTGVLVVLALALSGFVVGSKTYLSEQSTAFFYQSYFGAAVSIACTGHIDAVVGNAQVDAFLSDPAGTLKSCEGVDATRSENWGTFDTSTLYLFLLTALAWVVFGFSWSSLAAVAGLFAAGFTIGAYLFIRCLTSSRILAFGLALAVLFAPPVIEQIPNLRDFSKAPLILLGLGLIGRATLSQVSFRRTLLFTGSVGLLIGVGKGLRPDAILLVPVALAALLLWCVGGQWKRRIRQALGALFALLFGYIAGSAPVTIVAAMKNATADTNAHVLILGFAETYQNALGFERGNYALLSGYFDEQAEGLVNLYHSGVGPLPAPMNQASPSYGPPSYELLSGMLAAVPHDALMRVFATANALGAYPINNLVYGPLLVLVLAGGFILFPRRILFYCLSASVIVPILSLHFHSRHAFYAVAFGAAALGLAYTVAVTATMAVLNRNAGDRPTGPQIRRRTTLLCGPMASIIVLVYTSAHLAKQHQERALVQLYQTFASAIWSPIEMIRDSGGVRFPTLASNSEPRVGFMALSFAFPDAYSTVGVLSNLDWQPIGTTQLTDLDDGGFRIKTNGQRGYQSRSRLIEMAELNRTSEESEYATLSLRIRGVADTAGWTIGALAHDESRWISTERLPFGTFDRGVTMQIPRAEPGFRLILEASETGATNLDLNQFVASNAAALQDCKPTPWNIAPLRRYGNSLVSGTPMAIPASESGTYYFPFAQISSGFDSVTVDGVSSRCVTRARIAQTLPAHTLPIELVEINGSFQPTQRRLWRDILRDFTRWHRPALY